jgi:hypothetical protein
MKEDFGGDFMDRDILDETAVDEIIEEWNNVEIPAEQELNFDEDFQGEHEGGHIYESIENEVGQAADEAAVEEIPDDDGNLATDYEEQLPESFFL